MITIMMIIKLLDTIAFSTKSSNLIGGANNGGTTFSLSVPKQLCNCNNNENIFKAILLYLGMMIGIFCLCIFVYTFLKSIII